MPYRSARRLASILVIVGWGTVFLSLILLPVMAWAAMGSLGGWIAAAPFVLPIFISALGGLLLSMAGYASRAGFDIAESASERAPNNSFKPNSLRESA